MIGNTNTVAENFYYLLWIKDSGLQESKFPVRIPDTILVSGRQITNWYFTGSNDQVLKKKVNNLKPQEVFDSFTKQNYKSGIVAQIIQGEQRGDKLTKIQQKAKQTYLLSAQENEKVMVKYLNEEELYQFLFVGINEQDLDESLILQKFIDPYGECNNCVQAIWSPSTCLFTKRINNRHLNDLQYEPYERAVTFDGPEIFSKSVCLKGKQISGEIRRLCENIVKRIAHVTYERTMINRMTVYFKADRNNKLYFLYCTSLRLKDEIKNIAKRRELDPEKYLYNNTPLIIDNNFERPPNMKNVYSISTTRPLRLENDLDCLSCDNMYQLQDMFEIPFIYLLRFENFSKNSNLKQSQTEENLLAKLKNQQKMSGGRGKKRKLVEVVLTNRQIMHFLNDQSPEEPFNFDKTKLYVDANQAPPHPLLAKLFPKMSKENYQQFKEKGNFDNLKIRLCHSCYFYYTQNQVITGAPLIPSESEREIKHNIAPKGQNLLSSQMLKITLQKNLELAREFDFVKYQQPDVYEQRLQILSREEEYAIKKPQQIQIKKKLTPAKKEEFDDSEEINPEPILSNRSEYKMIQKNEKQHSSVDVNRKEQLQIKDFHLLNSNPKKEKKADSNLQSKIFSRPQTTKIYSLLDDSEKYQKRFDLLLNLTQKGLKTKFQENQSAIFSQQKRELSQRELFLTERDKFNKNQASHSSKQTVTTNDDSFSKKKDSILELYLNACDQKNQKEEPKVKEHQKLEQKIANRGISPIYCDRSTLRLQTPDKSISITTEQNQNVNQQDNTSSKQLAKYPLFNSKNEATTANFSASSYRSIYSGQPDSFREKFLPKSPNTYDYLNQKSYSRKKIIQGKGHFQIASQNSNTNSQMSSLFDQSTKSQQNIRPNTTQNNSNRLFTIQEGSQDTNNANPACFKVLKNPYLPYRTLGSMKSSQHKIQIQEDKNKINQQSNLQERKSYTSHSQRPKFFNQVNSTNNNKSISPDKNSKVYKGSLESPLSKNSNQKNENLQTEATNQITIINSNTSRFQQQSPTAKIEETGINTIENNSNDYLFSQRTEDHYQSQANPTEQNEQSPIFKQKVQEQGEGDKQQNEDSYIINTAYQQQQTSKQINNYFNSEEGYNKEIDNIIQDYNQ